MAIICVYIAEVVTYMGRTMIYRTRDEADRAGLMPVYGDSVTGDTPLIVRDSEYDIPRVVTISDLADEWVMHDRVDGKEESRPWGVQVYDERGWTRITRVIRHATNKPIWRVLIHTGVVDCTEDHSLILEDGDEIRPNDLKPGRSALMTTNFDDLLCEWCCDESITVSEAEAMGLFFADGSCGVYYSQQLGIKHTWVINKGDYALLEHTQQLLPFETKILNTDEIHGFKLVPIGNSKDPTIRYRNLFYDDCGNKVIPQCILFGPIEIAAAFFKGFYAGAGDKKAQEMQTIYRFDQKSKTTMAGLYILSRRLGWSVSMNVRADNPNIFRLNLNKTRFRKPMNVVKKKMMISDGTTETVVYDLETESHHFAVGPGNLVVHNTDSVMMYKRIKTDEEAHRVLVEFCKYMTNVVWGDPGNVNEFEAEQLARQYIMYDVKKLYIKRVSSAPGKPYSMAASGICTQRRDRPKVLTDVVEDIMSVIEHAYMLCRPALSKLLVAACLRHFERMVDNTVPMEKYVICVRVGKLESEMVLPQLVIAKRLAAEGVHLRKGDAVRYVQLRLTKKQKKEGVVASEMVERPEKMETKYKNPIDEVDRATYFNKKVWPQVASTLGPFLSQETLDFIKKMYSPHMEPRENRSLRDMFKTKTSDAEMRFATIMKHLDAHVTKKRVLDPLSVSEATKRRLDD